MEKIEKIREEIKNANARIKERENANKADADKIITAWDKLRAGGGQALTLTEAEHKRNDEIAARMTEREQENDKRAAELVKAWKREGDKFKKYDITPAEQENNERLERAMANAEQENKRDKIRAEILRENLKAAIAETVKPILFDILEKYEGKPYGDKTREKIAEEARAACGYRLYIGEKYGSAEVKIYGGSEEGITLYAQGLDIFGGELKNRLRAPLETEKAAFKIAYERARYTEPEQIDARIDEIITAQEEARRAQEAYNAAIDKYNAVIAGKMESLKREYQRIDK